MVKYGEVIIEHSIPDITLYTMQDTLLHSIHTHPIYYTMLYYTPYDTILYYIQQYTVHTHLFERYDELRVERHHSDSEVREILLQERPQGCVALLQHCQSVLTTHLYDI